MQQPISDMPPEALSVDPNPPVWPGAKDDELRVAPDGLPARVVQAHNAHKAHYIQRYAHTVAIAMKNKWPHRAYIDTYAGPGICWVEGTGAFVLGSPLIARNASPNFTHHVFVDMDPRCTDALETRLAGLGATIITANSNAPETIARVRAAIPQHGCLALALLDPQGCTLHLDAIRALTADRRMDLMINFPVLSLFRCLGARQFHVLEAVLGPDFPPDQYGDVKGWGAVARQHFRDQLHGLGYAYTSAKEVRAETTKVQLYDFVLASKNELGKKLFDDVTRKNAHGWEPLF